MQDDYSGIGHGGFPHTKQVRIDYIKKLGEPVRRGYKIPGESGLHDVYAVDFDYLIYNFDNGRYFTDKKTRENELGRDVFDNESHLIQATNIIENILWDENEEENELTIKDLLKNRQEIPGPDLVMKDHSNKVRTQSSCNSLYRWNRFKKARLHN